MISAFERDQARVIADQLSVAIEAEQWLKANDLSNQLEAFVVSAAGNIDEDNVLYSVDPFDLIGELLTIYLNTPGKIFST